VRLVALIAVTACGSTTSTAPPPPPPVETRTGDEQAPPPIVGDDEIAPPAECGKRTWRQCLSAARSLVQQRPNQQEEGVVIYKLLCGEGDRRRCFEPDTPADVSARCHEDGLVLACFELAGLYSTGLATCPLDEACASVLYLMSCQAGEQAACAE
jgi:hypothetical protein